MIPSMLAAHLENGKVTALRLPKPRRPEGYRGLLGKMNESVRNCDHLHNDICDRFCRVQSFDAGTIAPLMSAFEELDRLITNAIASCNVFEFGPRIEAL